MKLMFIQLMNAVNQNLVNRDFTQFLNKQEYSFLVSLLSENVGLLSTIFDSIRQIQQDDKVTLSDVPQILSVIITVFRVFLLKKKMYDISLYEISKFLIETLIANDILPFKEAEYEKVKTIISTTLQILNTNVQIKRPKFLSKLKKMFRI